MAQVPAASSSSTSRKRKLNDVSSEASIHLSKLGNQSLSDSIVTGSLTNTEAITYHFQLMYNEELELSEGSRKCLLDSTCPSLQRLQNGSAFSSKFHDSKAPALDSPAWTSFASFAEELIELSISPSKFIQNLPNYAQSKVVEVCSEEDANNREKSGLYEDYYTRILDVNPEEYRKRLERQGQKYPNDLPFIMIQLQYLGFRERAKLLLKRVMQGLGFPGVQIELDSSIDGVHPTLRATYSGATIYLPEDRQAGDRNAHGNTSRMKNFLQLNQDVEWIILRWIPLQQALSRKLDWRTEEKVGQIEAILTDCTQPNYNKARGGWMHPIEIHDTVSKPLRTMLAMLPPPHPSDQVPVELTADLDGMVDGEFALMSELEESEGLGGLFGDPVVQYVKKEFVERIRYINGGVTSLNLVKDVPKELGDGLIQSSWCSDEAGRSVAQYQRILRAIDDLEPKEKENDYETIRSLDGPVLDFWRFPKLHKWWGLLVLLTGLYLRRARPYVIHSWSSEMSRLLRSTIMVTLPLELAPSGVDLSLQGREAMVAISAEILNSPQIRQTMNAPKDRNLREHVGTIHKVMFGPGELDFANNLVKGHLGSTFYRRVYFRYDTRRFTLVHGLSIALNRITDAFAARRKAPTTQDERIDLLNKIATEFERVANNSGVRAALDGELQRQRICDQAQGALLGKSVEGDEEGDEMLVETLKKRKKVERKYPRNNGVLARGDARSLSRRMQLTEMQDVDALAQKLGLGPPLVGPDGGRPNTPEYSKWFLNLPANLSISQSLNAHGRTPEGIQGHKDNGRRLAELNKEWALATRMGKTKLLGGWIRAEQFEQLTMLIPKLREDMTSHKFEKLPRAAKCAKEGCLQRVLGKDKNATHRCTEETASANIVKTSFTSYLPVLYPHDLLTSTDIDLDVRALAAEHCHLVASPAVDWVFDENGFLLDTFPFPLHPHLFDSISGVVYWDDRKPKEAPENLLMAADVVLRDVCPGYTSLEVAACGGSTILDGAHALCNQTQEKPWKQDYMDRVVDAVEKSAGKLDGCICLRCGDVKLEYGKKRIDMMIHAPCTRGSNPITKSESDFYWFSPRRLTDLPHSIARIFLYRAVRGGIDGKPVEAIEDWRRLLEWSG